MLTDFNFSFKCTCGHASHPWYLKRNVEHVSTEGNSFICYNDISAIWSIATGRNEVVAKVIFLHACVILSTGGGVPDQETLPNQTHPPTRHAPPGTKYTPWD